MQELLKILTEEIGLSSEAAFALIDEFGELDAQTHAMYCLWMMDKGKVQTPTSLVYRVLATQLESAPGNVERLVTDRAPFPFG